MELQLLFTGLGVGSIYALVALGFVLIVRATNVVNFAQGDFAMLGGFAMVVCAVDLELPYGQSVLIALAAVMAFGALFNLLVYYPLRHRGLLPVIISTIGASILMQNGMLAAYGPQKRPAFPRPANACGGPLAGLPIRRSMDQGAKLPCGAGA